MKTHRRAITPFNLSFLDIMFCGFGAVVLLVLILNADTVKTRKQHHLDLQSQVTRLGELADSAGQDLALRRSELDALEREIEEKEAAADKVVALRQQRITALRRAGHEIKANSEQLEHLKKELLRLDSENARLDAEKSKARGQRVRQFVGEGDRQYLTGLKLGGRYVLILLDDSASMLDESLVNIIRLRNMDQGAKRRAEKWQRALATVEWLLSNLAPGSRYQLFRFNTTAGAVLPGSDIRWLESSDGDQLDRVVVSLRKLTPAGGTSLYRAFKAVADLDPRPDNIILITDGLPTQGKSRPRSDTVTAERRLAHFKRALDALPKGIPVNTLLLPMEGDAYAAAAFWELAMISKGAFITPSRDWP